MIHQDVLIRVVKVSQRMGGVTVFATKCRYPECDCVSGIWPGMLECKDWFNERQRHGSDQPVGGVARQTVSDLGHQGVLDPGGAVETPSQG